VDIINYS